MSPREALECNIDVAQRELDARAAQGEDVSELYVCQKTAQILRRAKPKALRVSYINGIDGKRRVFAGGLDQATADKVMARWGNPKERYFYMGPGIRVEECDGTPDGALVADSWPTLDGRPINPEFLGAQPPKVGEDY
jgi:hypothetical protein